MLEPMADVTGTWWSYTEGNTTLVGLVVAVVAVAAIVFVATRVLARARRRR